MDFKTKKELAKIIGIGIGTALACVIWGIIIWLLLITAFDPMPLTLKQTVILTLVAHILIEI